MSAFDNYPNLKAINEGRVSGGPEEWPMIKSELKRLEHELHYLAWFKQNADFGPADSDVHMILADNYMDQTERSLPLGWEETG